MFPFPFIKVAPPPGLFMNSTKNSRKVRWSKGNLVRWFNGALVAIGGWHRTRKGSTSTEVDPIFNNATTEAPRNAFSWRANNGDTYVAIGTNLGLYVIDPAGDVDEITPGGFSSFLRNTGVELEGYGIGPYGAETYGTPRQNITPRTDSIPTWMFDNWGEDLIATVTGNNQPIYDWSPGDAAAVAVSNAPVDSRDVCVTPQRILFSIGDSDDQRLVEWSTSEDNTNWTPAADNQAGFQLLNGKGRLMRCLPVGADVLIIGEHDVQLARYVGPPYIFGFQPVGSNTTIVAPLSAVKVGESVYWLGKSQFWVYSEGRVIPLPCDVMEYLKAHIDETYQSKISAQVIAEYNEIWWHYQSKYSDTVEADSYVSYNYVEGFWMIGKLDRVCGTDGGQFQNVLMVSSDGKVYTHEVPATTPPPADTFAETGAYSADDFSVMYIGSLYTDVEARSILNAAGEGTSQEPASATFVSPNVYLLASDDLNGAEREHGPYIATAGRISTRGVRGRHVKVRVNGVSQPWRAAEFKLEQNQIGGTRRGG